MGNNFTFELSRFYNFFELLGKEDYQLKFEKTQVKLFPNFIGHHLIIPRSKLSS